MSAECLQGAKQRYTVHPDLYTLSPAPWQGRCNSTQAKTSGNQQQAPPPEDQQELLANTKFTDNTELQNSSLYSIHGLFLLFFSLSVLYFIFLSAVFLFYQFFS